MSDPNLPEGVKQSDIDAAVGETFDPNVDSEIRELADELGQMYYDAKFRYWDMARFILEGESVWKSKIKALEAIVKRYARHNKTCDYVVSFDYLSAYKPCSCGYDKCMAELKPMSDPKLPDGVTQKDIDRSTGPLPLTEEDKNTLVDMEVFIFGELDVKPFVDDTPYFKFGLFIVVALCAAFAAVCFFMDL